MCIPVVNGSLEDLFSHHRRHRGNFRLNAGNDFRFFISRRVLSIGNDLPRLRFGVRDYPCGAFTGGAFALLRNACGFCLSVAELFVILLFKSLRVFKLSVSLRRRGADALSLCFNVI